MLRPMNDRHVAHRSVAGLAYWDLAPGRGSRTPHIDAPTGVNGDGPDRFLEGGPSIADLAGDTAAAGSDVFVYDQV
jgi:hypothetical protein